jgi:hypothetical protein
MIENEETIKTYNEEWLKKQKEQLKHIKGFKTDKDRLISTTQLSYMQNALCTSILSWNNWVSGWVSLELSNKINVKQGDMFVLTDEELLDLHKKYKEFAIKFIELDIAVTEAFSKKSQVKRKNSIKPKISNEGKMVA